MKLTLHLKVVFTGALLAMSQLSLAKSPQYSLVLMGGGMDFCSSIDENHCETPLRIDSATHRENIFQVTQSAIDRISESHWQIKRQDVKAQVSQILSQVANRKTGMLSYKQLVNEIRQSRTQIAGRNVSGATMLRNLTEKERHLIFDMLQQANVKQGILGGGERRVVKASLSKTKSKFATGLVREFVSLAKQLADDSDKPNVLLVTAAQRDPFESVDLYSDLLDEAGANVTWLPLDASFVSLTQGKGNEALIAACGKLDSQRALYQNAYRRSEIYPDLANYQLANCQQPELLDKMLEQADALFFAPGSASLLTSSFLDAMGRESQILAKLKSKHNAGNLIVAADEGATMAMSGGTYRNNQVAMLTNGTSLEGLGHGAVAKRAPERNCQRTDTCPPGLNEKSLTYNANGGLGFFPHGILDTNMSEKSRQGRLIRVSVDAGVDMAYGIDERTALLVGLQDEFDGDLNMEIIGENGVFIVDSSEVQMPEKFQPRLNSVKTHFLTHEDKIFFRSNKFIVSFADWKYSVNNASRPVIQSGKALSRDNYRRMTNLLCLTSSSNASLKHVNVGQGFTIQVQKGRTSISLTGSRNVNGLNYGSCSYRDYYLDIAPI